MAILGRSSAAALLARGGNHRVVAASAHAIQLAGSMLLCTLMPGQTGLLVLGVALFGLGIGNVTSLPPLVAQGEFATQDVPRVVALIVGIGQATFAFPSAIFAAVLASSGAAQGGGIGERSSGLFLLAACIQLAVAAAFLAGRPRRRRCSRAG